VTLWERIKYAIAAGLAATLIKTLYMTMRVRHMRVENMQRTPQYIIAFWHAHLLMMVKCRFRTPISVLISQSKDGELIARTMAHFDVDSTRGSSSRGGTQAMRELLRLARMGINLVFTPDGPRGPARVASDGIVYAAQMTGLPIIPVAFAARKRKLLRSWDRMVVPHPFTEAIFLYGDPIVVPRNAPVEDERLRIEREMNMLADNAERMMIEYTGET
jgi:lysophospholipid acyltransferase (LPLAT)-like uncharacterized protein